MSGGDRTGDRPVLIRGAGVITMDPAIGELSRADILVRGSMIVEIGERINATPDAEVIESAKPGLQHRNVTATKQSAIHCKNQRQ
jgi:hypothetical protein